MLLFWVQASCSHTVLPNNDKQEGCTAALASFSCHPPWPYLEIRGVLGGEDTLLLQEFREASMRFLTRSARPALSNWGLALPASHSMESREFLFSRSLIFSICELG